MERAMNPQPRMVVMRAGGIGGIVAATLTEVGAAVTAVSTNPAIRAAVDQSGYRVLDDGEERVVRGWIAPAPEGSYDLCILATQPPNVEEAALAALRHLAPDAQVVVLQNGLCEDRVAQIVGGGRAGADRRGRWRDRRDRRLGRVDARARPLRAHRARRVLDRPAVGRDRRR